MTLVVGLTGGIGSGKSTVGQLFAERGAALVDTDLIARELTQAGGAAMPAIAVAFGGAYVEESGALDRDAMRQIVFSDRSAKRRLEEILHPLIRVAADQLLDASAAPYAILVVPLLIESGAYGTRLNRILVVDCSEATQIRRTMARSGLSEQAVRAIMSAQTDRTTRLAAADDIIDNDADLASLIPQVEYLHRLYTTLRDQTEKKFD